LNRSFLDYDAGQGWLWRTGPLWDDLLELVEMEAKRLANIFPLGHIAVIGRSDDGWHLRFPKARLTQKQEEAVMHESKSHYGHKWFSTLVGDTTLRVSKTPKKNSHEIWLREVLYLG
jgi:hypothetical protein